MSSRQGRRIRYRRLQESPDGGFDPRPTLIGMAVVLIVAAALFFVSTNRSSAFALPTVQPIPPASMFDGIQCNAGEQIVYHIHQHIALFDHGKHIRLPSSIGIPGTESGALCLYWLHVHSVYPNIIHVESPIIRTFSLGDFFDIWKATESDSVPQRGGVFLTDLLSAPAGQITVFVDGKLWTKGYRRVKLLRHAVIQIDLGNPVVPFKAFTEWSGL